MIDSVIEFNEQSMIQSLKFVEANNVNKNIFEIINYQKAIRYQSYINICDWFADSKLSYQTGHEKTKYYLQESIKQNLMINLIQFTIIQTSTNIPLFLINKVDIRQNQNQHF